MRGAGGRVAEHGGECLTSDSEAQGYTLLFATSVGGKGIKME